MKTLSLAVFFAVFAFVLLSYTSARAQEDNTDKSRVEKATEGTQKTITKTTVVVTDNLQTAAEKTKAAVTTPAKSTKTFGNNAVEVTESAVGQPQQQGKWHTVTTWDGSKWVPKRVFYPNKPAEEAKTNN